MAVFEDIALNAAADAIAALADGGDLQFREADNSEVATCALSNPAFAAAVGGVATANAVTADNNVAGGTVDHVVVRTNAGAVITTLTVSLTGGGGEAELTDLTYGAGGSLEVASFTLPVANA